VPYRLGLAFFFPDKDGSESLWDHSLLSAEKYGALFSVESKSDLEKEEDSVGVVIAKLYNYLCHTKAPALGNLYHVYLPLPSLNYLFLITSYLRL